MTSWVAEAAAERKEAMADRRKAVVAPVIAAEKAAKVVTAKAEEEKEEAKVLAKKASKKMAKKVALSPDCSDGFCRLPSIDLIYVERIKKFQYHKYELTAAIIVPY